METKEAVKNSVGCRYGIDTESVLEALETALSRSGESGCPARTALKITGDVFMDMRDDRPPHAMDPADLRRIIGRRAASMGFEETAALVWEGYGGDDAESGKDTPSKTIVFEVEKRDGRTVSFDGTRIASAVRKALTATGESNRSKETSEEIRSAVVAELEKESIASGRSRFGVEEIQDLVERQLMLQELTETAKAYILYRSERSRRREMNSRLMETFRSLDASEAEASDLKRENANIDGNTAMGTMLRYGSEGAKAYNSLFVLSPEASAVHRDGDIHIHDMDFLTLTMTCCQIDLRKLFEGGFGTGHGTIREPSGIRAAASLACIALQANQNDMHGGQSIPNFDHYMADYVEKTFFREQRLAFRDWLCIRFPSLSKQSDLLSARAMQKIRMPLGCFPDSGDGRKFDETSDIDVSHPVLRGSYAHNLLTFMAEEAGQGISDDEAASACVYVYNRARTNTTDATYQAMEALVHNLNTMHSRAGAQVPFSSVNFGTSTSPYGRMVIREFLNAVDSGLGRHETAIFPVSIFKVKDGVNYGPEDPNRDLFELACRVSAHRLFPNFAFLDAPFNLQYYKEYDMDTEAAYMGCRTRVVANSVDPSRQIVTGRGNLSFTSVNLPRLALSAAATTEDIEERKRLFFESLDRQLATVERQLLDRFEIQAEKHVFNFPFLMGQGIWIDSDKLKKDDKIREVIKHGTLSVGFIGLAETLKALCGSHHGETEEARSLGLEIVSHMRRRVDEMGARNKLNFSLIATPAEGLAGRFVRMDRKRFGSVPGVTDREYYTNSFHIPVYFQTTFARKIEAEAPYHELCNGGHITYVEMDGDPTGNMRAFFKVVDAMKKAGIGYGAINHPLDRDPVCGYTGVIGDVCPGCGREEGSDRFERIRRITGYLVGTLDRFNDAKRAEEHDRVKHGRAAGHLPS